MNDNIRLSTNFIDRLKAGQEREPMERTMQILGIIALVGLMTVLSFAIFAPHTVQQYYVGPGGTGSCVIASVNWDDDLPIYCSDDIRKVVDVADHLNRSLLTPAFSLDSLLGAAQATQPTN